MHNSHDETYNGWSNYETWLVALWLDNDQSSYEWLRETVQGAQSLSDAADTLRDHVEEYNPLAESASMYVDLLRSAIAQVNWYEIVTNVASEC